MPPTDVEVLQAVRAPKPNPRNNTTMFQIFQNVQYNVVQHKKYIKEMKKLFKKLDEDVFRESFKNALHYLFTFGDTSANVDRVVQFVASFCTALDDEEEFLLFIFEIIFDCQCVSGQSVRYRASQLLAAVLSALGEDASLDEDLCDKLLASQMQRLQDTRGAVRCRAALALQRLQNPMEPDDDVTRAYRFHMSCDPSSSVRRAIVMSIAKCTRNVPFVLERLCDVDEAVRRAAFLYISAVNVTQLRVRQRVLTLKVGLSERSHRVRRVVEEILVPGWLSTFQGNVISLLKAIRLDNAHDAKDSQYVAGKLLESLFKRLSISELLEWLPTDKTLRLIPAEKLNKESAWYWRHLAEHLQKIEDDETLELVLPDLVVLVGYIRAIVESPCPDEAADPVSFGTRQQVLHSLGGMLRVYDISDPATRAAVRALITDLLTGDYGPLSPDVIRVFVRALELVEPDVARRLQALGGVLGALRDPPDAELPAPTAHVDDTEAKLQRAKLRVSLNVAIEAQEEAVRDENYALAAECKAKVADIQKQLEEINIQPVAPPPSLTTIREKVSDAATLNKCLIILNSALDTSQLNSLTPMLRTVFTELEVEIFQNPDILENALETVGLYGLLDKNFAKENKAFLFANLVDTSNERAVSTVLRCVVDLLCVHGAHVFQEAREDSQTDTTRNTSHYVDATDEDGTLSESALSMSPANNTIIELLLQLMDSTCSGFRLIIVEGLCRLLHLGHLESPSIISRLLLLWFNPATVDEDMLRQTIGVFFQTFPTNVDGAQEQIQKATIPTLRALANAPSSSPLAEIDQEAVVRFIVSLTRVNYELSDSQGELASLVCSWLARHPAARESALLCRVLALLGVPRAGVLRDRLAPMLRDLCTKLPDKQSCRNLTRYLGALEASERASLTKMSNTGVAEGTLQSEDTIGPIGRLTTSLPQPLARSTHVVINETVEEELEIDETSPTDMPSKITEESRQEAPVRTSDSDCGDNVEQPDGQSDSSGVSPVKKAKVAKGKKKLSMTRSSKKSQEQEKTKGKGRGKQESAEPEGGVKRSRSQRSLVDVDRARKAKSEAAKAKQSPPKQSSPPADLDVSNVTVRKSSRGIQSSSSTDSVGSSKGKKEKADKKKEKGDKKKETKAEATRALRRSSRSSASSRGSAQLFDDSADETELHTIVYDAPLEQSLLNDSDDNEETSKKNITIPETPDASEESESEPEAEVKSKLKQKRNKK